MTITNLRIPTHDYLRIKSLAVESGLSINDLVLSVFDNVSVISGLVKTWYKPKASKVIKKHNIWELSSLAKIKNKPMGLSPDDEIVYES